MPEIQAVAPGLWVFEGLHSLLGVTIGRRMVVVQLPDGSLQLHSPVPIGPYLQESLARLGRVGAIIAPTAFHDTFLPEVLPLFPEAAFYASPGLPAVGRKPTDLGEAPASWREILDWERIAGMPKVNEYVFLHKPSRTLLVSDLVFHIGQEADAWTRLFFKANGAFNCLRPTRLFRVMIRDRDAFRESLLRVMDWDFDRLVMSHGRIVEFGAKDRLRTELLPACRK